MVLDLRYAAAILALFLAATQARAESLSERRAAKEKVETIEVEVACGKLDKENCAIVVPEINSKTVSQGVRLKPLESKGSVESVNGLCDGDVDGGGRAGGRSGGARRASRTAPERSSCSARRSILMKDSWSSAPIRGRTNSATWSII